MTNIAKGECRGKRKSCFRIGSAEPYPIFYKYTKTRSHTDGFRRNNANYWNKREICRFYLYSSIIWFCPVLEELGK